jgi:GNAT superfamily N-acetyltransferase
MPTLTLRSYTGAAIREAFMPLATLRITVFREFPYLYQGSVAYETVYLDTYAQSEQALLFAVFDGDTMVGATTCLPLVDETAAVQEPFRRAGYVLDEIFYFGESLLLPAYRGLGLGHRFFDEREAHVARSGTYAMTCFCAVQRPTDHPLQPPNHRPLDAFWHSRGYHRDSSLQSIFFWPDLGETTDTGKPMVYWVRRW